MVLSFGNPLRFAKAKGEMSFFLFQNRIQQKRPVSWPLALSHVVVDVLHIVVFL
jgi:hypothetical protein